MSSVGDEVYLALDKGPITPQHALIIPIEHHPSLAALSAEAAKEVGRWAQFIWGGAPWERGSQGWVGELGGDMCGGRGTSEERGRGHL